MQVHHPRHDIPAPAAGNVQQVQLDPTLTIACTQAVVAAYAYWDNKTIVPPNNFRPVAGFTGWDSVFSVIGTEERFGLIFQSTLDLGTYLVAIRGTDSILDGYEDIWANTVPFQPYDRPSNFPGDVNVASGFNSIYTGRGGSMVGSMQQQLFGLLQQFGAKTVLIAGHSLGGALASLFALDVAVSRPQLIVSSTTLASPMVGKDGWQSIYNYKYSLLQRTFRLANYYDLVPSLPPGLLGYQHIGQQFLVSFYVDGEWLPHYLARHALLNYQVVVGNAVVNNPQIWTGYFADRTTSGRLMISVTPPSTEVPAWADVVAAAEKQAVGRSAKA